MKKLNHDVKHLKLELICVISNFGMGSKLLKTAKNNGVLGGTISLAKGTVHNRILDYIGLTDIRKEILYMVADEETADHALEKMNAEYKFYKPHHGIAFTTSICNAVGTKCAKDKELNYENIERGENNSMYQLITVIVEKGKAEEVIEAAEKAGSKGGTIINARGAGTHETSKLFSMDIEPEKEIVIILSEYEMTQAIVTSINQDLNIDRPGKGIVYVQNVNKTYGIYK